MMNDDDKDTFRFMRFMFCAASELTKFHVDVVLNPPRPRKDNSGGYLGGLEDPDLSLSTKNKWKSNRQEPSS